MIKFDSSADWSGGWAASCRQILNLDVRSLGAKLVAADILGLSEAGRGGQLAIIADSSCFVDLSHNKMFCGVLGVGEGVSKIFCLEFLLAKKTFLVVISQSNTFLGTLELGCSLVLFSCCLMDFFGWLWSCSFMDFLPEDTVDFLGGCFLKIWLGVHWSCCIFWVYLWLVWRGWVGLMDFLILLASYFSVISSVWGIEGPECLISVTEVPILTNSCWLWLGWGFLGFMDFFTLAEIGGCEDFVAWGISSSNFSLGVFGACGGGESWHLFLFGVEYKIWVGSLMDFGRVWAVSESLFGGCPGAGDLGIFLGVFLGIFFGVFSGLDLVAVWTLSLVPPFVFDRFSWLIHLLR